MDIYVINPFQTSTPHFPVIGVIDKFVSCLWDIQLYGLGEFNLTIPATPENLSLIVAGRFLVRDKDISIINGTSYYYNVMVIRKTELRYNPDDGYMIYVWGRTIKDIFSQRIIWNQINYTSTALTVVIYQVLYQNVVDPEGYCDGVIANKEGVIDDLEDDLARAQSDAATAYETYESAVEDFGPDSPQAQSAYETYQSCVEVVEDIQAELTEKQNDLGLTHIKFAGSQYRQIPYVSAGVIDIAGFTPPVVTVQLHGENIGEWLEEICTQNNLGWEIVLSENVFQMGFVVGTDRSSTVIFSPEYDNLRNSSYIVSTEAYKNAGQVGGEGEGINQITTGTESTLSENPFPIFAGIDRFEDYIDGKSVSSNGNIISQNIYVFMLKQFGQSDLIGKMITKTFEAEIETQGIFKIGVDYKLGDYVTISNDKGISAKTRLIETTDVEDENGTQTQAIFEEMEVS